jgi:hypothetical protein
MTKGRLKPARCAMNDKGPAEAGPYITAHAGEALRDYFAKISSTGTMRTFAGAIASLYEPIV